METIPSPSKGSNPDYLAASLVVGRFAYIDTVALWIIRKATPSESKALRRSTIRRRMKTEYRGLRGDSRFRCRLCIHQPTPETFRLLAALAETCRLPNGEPGLFINRLDVALELMTETWADAREFGFSIKQTLVKLWPGKLKPHHCGDTCYTTGRKWGVCAPLAYDDRPSKITGLPCVKIECRVTSRGRVEELGIVCPSDVLNLDFTNFWREHLTLALTKTLTLGRQFLGQPKAKKAEPAWYLEPTPTRRGIGYPDEYRRVGYALRAALGHKDGIGGSQAVKVAYGKCEWFRAASVLQKIDNTPFLPGPSDYLVG